MKVTFRTRQLERAFSESATALRRWGDKAGRRYVTRIIQLSEARDFADIRALAALRAHQLKGARRGEWAIDLTERWRLIVRLEGDDEVSIEEVSRHYGD